MRLHCKTHGYLDEKTGPMAECPYCRINELENRIEKLEAGLNEIIEWSEAYPEDVFPQPTPDQIDAVCKQSGFRIDSISAMVLRRFTGYGARIAREALKGSDHDR